MRVLIVENEYDLGKIWQSHMERLGVEANLVTSYAAAVTVLESEVYDVMVLDLVLENGAALALSDFAAYRHPDVQVVFVTNTTFFSDGSIFNHSANVCAFMPTGTPPDDLAAMVEHYGNARQAS
ncbi:response regulator [Shimia sp.]|uniref:response regulator n=1 Tax=Shimia sp. TaxID=1954381 RepID=UPI003297BE3A